MPHTHNKGDANNPVQMSRVNDLDELCFAAYLQPDDPSLPRIVTVRTTSPHDLSVASFMVPYKLWVELDPINTTAASLYVAVGRAGKGRTRRLDLVRDVFWRIAWFHNWKNNQEALADVMDAAALLERQGWLSRQPASGGGERWTVLGRDQSRRAPAETATGHVVA